MLIHALARGYVSRTVGLGMLGAFLALLLLTVLFAFLGQLEKINASYTLFNALQKIALEIPEQAAGILPNSLLMGAVIGLSTLSNTSELTALRASGVSIWRIVRWALLPSALFIVLQVCLVELVIPNMERVKGTLNSSHSETDLFKGYWFRQQNDFVYVDRADAQGTLYNITRYRLSDSGRLQNHSHTQSAQYRNQHWQGTNTTTATLNAKGGVTSTTLSHSQLAIGLSPSYIKWVASDPATMGLWQLWQYTANAKNDSVIPKNYQLEFWRKLLMPFSIIGLVMIGCSFVFGSVRQQSMGLRIVTALITGIVLNYIQQFLGYASLIAPFKPLWFVLIPVLAYFGLAYWLIKRRR